MLLQDKVALVTGASRGIGRATALTLANEGATVVLNARNIEHLEETADMIKEAGGTDPILLAYDVSDVAMVKEAFVTIQKQFKRLDIMVNNAGILIDSLLGMISPDMLVKTFSTNTYSVIYHMQYASRLMMRSRAGAIVNISSIIGRNGKEGLVAYGASKAAIIGATLSAAKELAPFNIRVNAVTPGFIDTDMTHQIGPEKQVERLANIKMGRPGEPEEVAKVVLFLASDMSSYMTGQILGVDGGMLE